MQLVQQLVAQYLYNDAEQDMSMTRQLKMKLAAELGHLEAMYKFAVMIDHENYSAKRNRPLSLLWLLRAANRGHLDAMYQYAIRKKSISYLYRASFLGKSEALLYMTSLTERNAIPKYHLYLLRDALYNREHRLNNSPPIPIRELPIELQHLIKTKLIRMYVNDIDLTSSNMYRYIVNKLMIEMLVK